MSQVTQEQSDTYQCVTSVVRFRIDNSTISFSTDYRMSFLHLGYYVDFTYG